MKLSEEVKDAIRAEYHNFKDKMYADSPKDVRDKLGQFFTSAELTIQMIESYPVETLADRYILDPTSGSGNLLAGCLIAGADSDKVFGNEYDPIMVKACRERLNNVCDLLGKPHIRDWQVHRGNAMDSFCLKEFGIHYKEKLRQHYLEIDDPLMLANGKLSKEREEFLKEVD